MGAYLERPVRHKEREDGVCPRGLRYAAVSMQGWRLAQEDGHIALPKFDERRGLGLFGVFDGHAGGVVSRLVVERFPALLRRAPSYRTGNYADALHEAFRSMDAYLDSPAARKEVRIRAKQEQERISKYLHVTGVDESEMDRDEALESLCCDNPDGMGCTAVVALVEHGPPARLHVANCGDSRGVLWNAKGRAVPMSKDHKPRCAGERARVEAAGGWVTCEGRIEGNLNLSRALADFDYKRTRRTEDANQQMISGVPEVRSRNLLPSDHFLLLGCDGVWETRRGSQSTVDVLRSGLPAGRRQKLSTALCRLFDQTVAEPGSQTGLGMDNMTGVLVELPGAPLLARAGNPKLASKAKNVRGAALAMKRRLISSGGTPKRARA